MIRRSFDVSFRLHPALLLLLLFTGGCGTTGVAVTPSAELRGSGWERFADLKRLVGLQPVEESETAEDEQVIDILVDCSGCFPLKIVRVSRSSDGSLSGRGFTIWARYPSRDGRQARRFDRLERRWRSSLCAGNVVESTFATSGGGQLVWCRTELHDLAAGESLLPFHSSASPDVGPRPASRDHFCMHAATALRLERRDAAGFDRVDYGCIGTSSEGTGTESHRVLEFVLHVFPSSRGGQMLGT